MANTISNSDDTIDSRDIIERIEELEGERDALQSDYDEKLAGVTEDSPIENHDTMIEARDALAAWDASDEAEELRTLKALAEEAEGYCLDWTYGAQLIRESHFEQAMDEMVDDCYSIPKELANLPWIKISYDYEMLKQDYTEVDFDGVAYFVR